MSINTAIKALHARFILDSRGRPTVEVDAELQGGLSGRGVAPSGASTGSSEAVEVRDGDLSQYQGRGVNRAVGSVLEVLAPALRGLDAADQRAVDQRLRETDGSENLSRLGGNAIIAVSMAVCRAAARSRALPLYRHLAELAGVKDPLMPLPMVNIFSGGLHARGGMDVQDFLVLPVGASSYPQALHFAERVRSAAAAELESLGLPTLLADEGGLSPGFQTGVEALRMLTTAIRRAGLEPGREVALGLDVAATTLQTPEGYRLAREGRTLSSVQMVEWLERWSQDFALVSVEDGLGEEDWSGWAHLSARLGNRLQLIGDDLFTTQTARLGRGVAAGIGNAVLVKVNQNGTVSGTLDVIAQAKASGYATIVSARSGETEDTFIADLAVGSAAGQIKIGSLRSSERLAKYNQLLRIQEHSQAAYAGAGALAGRP
ncbi:phosphopyruvate hydratase [Deinococcus sp.]|uniref:phosphopyruvate hydratase n=1 Tax=Deinococcus sp. TaxID=47478 RepID=UPI003CC67CCB